MKKGQKHRKQLQNSQNKQLNQIIFLFLRYIVILIAGLGSLFIFYKLFTIPTVKLSYLILKLFSASTATYSNIILFKSGIIELVPACIAGSAYYLLFILCLSVPSIKLLKRLLILVLAFSLFLVLNTFRIVLLALVSNTFYFNTLHLIFWYAISTLFVIAVWILVVKLFNIKTIPFYSDLKFLINSIKKTKRKS